MPVHLVSYTQGEKRNLEEHIAYVARVSNPANQENDKTSRKLLNYLIAHQHWSPFEMASICLNIHTTRDVARQILRHRSFAFQEFSQRYAEVDGSASFRGARMQDDTNRQSSLPCEDPNIRAEWSHRQFAAWEKAMDAYDWALNNGIAKEVARCVLPEGLTESRMYVHGTVRSWMHYIEVRTESSTQLEHRLIARACAKAIEPVFPMIKEFVRSEA